MPGSKRRAKGEGHLEQLPSGLWRVYTRVGGKKVSASAPTKAEAIAALKNKHGRLKRSARSSQSFGTFATEYLKTRATSLSPTTRETYAFWLKGFSMLANTQIEDLSELDVRRWKNSQHVAYETIRKRLGFLNQLLRECGRSDICLRVPGKREGTRRPLSNPERAKVKLHATTLGPRERIAILLCWHMGLRRSEACGLMHEDFDGEGVWIRRAVVVAEEAIHVREKGKSDRAHRWIPLPKALKGIIGKGKGFVLGKGRVPMHPKTLSWHFDRITKNSGLANVPHMGMHALRRTYGMTLLETGADVVTTAKTMGHDAQMLLEEYSKSRQDLQRKAVKKAFG